MWVGLVIVVAGTMSACLVVYARWPSAEDAEAARRGRAQEYIRAVFWAVNGGIRLDPPRHRSLLPKPAVARPVFVAHPAATPVPVKPLPAAKRGGRKSKKGRRRRGTAHAA
jgi:hypothetical protein